MDKKRVELVEQKPLVGEEGPAKEQFDKFHDDLNGCVYLIKG